jgi:hypothetical protein
MLRQLPMAATSPASEPCGRRQAETRRLLSKGGCTIVRNRAFFQVDIAWLPKSNYPASSVTCPLFVRSRRFLGHLVRPEPSGFVSDSWAVATDPGFYDTPVWDRNGAISSEGNNDANYRRCRFAHAGEHRIDVSVLEEKWITVPAFIHLSFAASDGFDSKWSGPREDV